MQAKGIPADVIHNFIKTYGMGRINQAKATMGFFKDYGLSNDALRIIGRNFTPEIIAQIENTYVKSLVFYTGNDTEVILILFKQASNWKWRIRFQTITYDNISKKEIEYAEESFTPKPDGKVQTNLY